MRKKMPKLVLKQQKKFKLQVVVMAALAAIGLFSWGYLEYNNWRQSKVSAGQTSSGDSQNDVKGVNICDDFSTTQKDFFVSFDGDRKWVLINPSLTDPGRLLKVNLEISEEYEKYLKNDKKSKVEYEIKGTELSGEMNAEFGSYTEYYAEVSLEGIDPGTYKIFALVKFDCGESITSDTYEFNLSYPLYVTWTFDWEGYPIKQEYLNDIDALTKKHSNFPLTHFFNPRLYTTKEISTKRQQELTNWVKTRRNLYGHEIGLHLHMFPDMVKAAGVEPQTEPAWGWYNNDGYDILVSGYSYQDMDKILDWSKDMFAKQGLGTPTIFRAGGWFADEGTLQVLQDNGFVLDSSGRTKFVFGTNNVESHWDLQPTTYPYQPSYNDQNVNGAPHMSIWEFPNNGGDSWAFSEQQMYNRFKANFDGGPLKKKQVITYLSHPEWFYEDKPKMDGLLTKIDKYKYSDDNGPVIYTTLGETYKIWTQTE